MPRSKKVSISGGAQASVKDDQSKTVELTSKEQAYADMRGKELGFLIGMLQAPDEFKRSLLTIASSLDYAQLEDFIDILEANYVNYCSRDFDTLYQQEIERLQARYAEKKKDILERATADIAQLTQQVQKASLTNKLK